MNAFFAFFSGILSFFSPCVLPLVPSYLIFLSGISFDDLSGIEFSKYRKLVIIHAISFIVGFSFVFVSLGLTTSLLGGFFSAYQVYILRIGGFILIIMGLTALNLFRIPLLDREGVIHLKEKPVGFFGSFIVGVTFSLGWTPCIGPALSSILIIAGSSKNTLQGVCLLSLYSAGLAIPFLLSAVLFDRIFPLLKRFRPIARHSMKVLGILLILIGLLLFTNYYGEFSGLVTRIFTF